MESPDTTVKQLVQCLPPDTTAFDRADTRGLDCLVALIRAMYAARALQADSNVALREFRHDEQNNPVIAFARQTFSEENSEASLERCANAKHNLLKALVGRHYTNQSTGFLRLLQSDLMDTYFSRPSFCLVRAVITSDGECTGPEDHGIIEWNCQDNSELTLESIIQARTEKKEGEVVRATAATNFIRVLYTPHESDPMGFRSLKRLRLPVGDLVHTSSPIFVHTSSSIFVEESLWEQYNFLAAVRMEGNDISIRTFDVNLKPQEIRTDSPVFSHAGWDFHSVSAAKYLLVYARLDMSDGSARVTTHIGAQAPPPPLTVRQARLIATYHEDSEILRATERLTGLDLRVRGDQGVNLEQGNASTQRYTSESDSDDSDDSEQSNEQPGNVFASPDVSTGPPAQQTARSSFMPTETAGQLGRTPSGEHREGTGREGSARLRGGYTDNRETDHLTMSPVFRELSELLGDIPMVLDQGLSQRHLLALVVSSWDRERGERLCRFHNLGPTGAWYCFSEIARRGENVRRELDPANLRCRYHEGSSCLLVQVKEEVGSRRLAFMER